MSTLEETGCPPTVDRNTRSSAAFPVIDISEKGAVAEIDAALRSWGGFVCTGHSIDPELLLAMQEVSRKFFALPQDVKDAVHLRHAGAQWRGYMPMGGERSEGGTLMDHKEGLYCGDEHDPNGPRCLAKLPTWGQNLLPDEALPSMRGVLQRYTAAVKGLGDRMMDLISIALGLDEKYIQTHVTQNDAISLVRIFHYPPAPSHLGYTESPFKLQRTATEPERWGIGSHSDYGLWTMILADARGLEFRHPEHGWVKVPLVLNGFVMNVGDVLDKFTGGLYKSRHHRARNASPSSARLSIPFFYDPNWTTRLRALPLDVPPGDAGDAGDAGETRDERWARTKITCDFDGRVQYSDLLAKKVAKVFPDLVPPRLLASLDSTSAPSTRHTVIVRVPEKQLTAALLDAIQDDRLRVTKHVLYETLGCAQLQLSQLHAFMEHHVWAVYDYFQLLKRLQAHLTCVRVPWAPTADPAMRRFISVIVLEEECDVFEDGRTHGSHLELYIRGMEQAGANTRPIKNFLKRYAEAGAAPSEAEVVAALEAVTTEAALEAVGAPRAAARHVRSTLDLAQRGSISEVAAVFTFGREDVIPAMFSQLLQGGMAQQCNIFRYYLERHIELDGDDHGPLAIALVERLCGTDAADEQTQARWLAAQAAAQRAFAMRVQLWDAVVEQATSISRSA